MVRSYSMLFNASPRDSFRQTLMQLGHTKNFKNGIAATFLEAHRYRVAKEKDTVIGLYVSENKLT